jgi:hypothetical protein
MKIITTILDIVIAFLHLLEGDGRILRRSVARLGWAVAFIAIVFILVLTSAGFLLLGMYQYLSSQISPVAASLLVSLLVFVLALFFAGISKWRVC